MARPAPDTKDWNAWIDTMPPGPGHLIVIGEVDVGNIASSADLKETVPQGINPKILLLDLTITLDGEGYPKKITSRRGSISPPRPANTPRSTSCGRATRLRIWRSKEVS